MASFDYCGKHHEQYPVDSECQHCIREREVLGFGAVVISKTVSDILQEKNADNQS